MRFACLALFSTFLLAPPALAGGFWERGASDETWLPWAELGGYGGSDDRTRGETNLFAPLWQDEASLFFFEGKGKFFEEGVREGNVALGYRRMFDSGFNFGIWAGWDGRRSEEDHTFHQVSVGIEALSPVWDLRMNGYIPITGARPGDANAEVELSGNRIQLVGGEEVPLHGLDGEVGYRVWNPTIFEREHELRLFAGGFYFDDDDADEDVSGPRVRSEWRVHDVVPGFPGSQIGFEVAYQHDDLRDHQWEAGLRLRMPLAMPKSSRKPLAGSARRMTAAIVRDVDVIFGRSKAEAVADAITGVRLEEVVRTDGGDDLQAVLDAAGANRLIIADGGNGTIAGNVTLSPEQTLQGGGSTIQVRGLDSGTVANFRAPGTQPRVEYLLGDAVVHVLDHDHVAGLRIVGAGMNAGIGTNLGIDGGNGRVNAAVTGNWLTDLGGTGIRFGDGSTRLVVRGNRLESIGFIGIDFDDDSADLVVRGNRLESIDFIGIDFDDRSTDLEVRDNRVESTGFTGFFFGNDTMRAVVTGNHLSDGGFIGIDFGTDSADVVVRGNRVEAMAFNGIDFGDRSTDLEVRDNRIESVAFNGIDFGDNTMRAVVIGNHVSDTGSSGIDFDDQSTDIRIENNVITDVALHFLEFEDRNVGLRIEGNTFRGTSGTDGMDFGEDNNGIVRKNRFEASFGDDVIDLDGSGNALRGDRNSGGDTFGDQFCEDAGGNDLFTIDFGSRSCPE